MKPFYSKLFFLNNLFENQHQSKKMLSNHYFTFSDNTTVMSPSRTADLGIRIGNHFLIILNSDSSGFGKASEYISFSSIINLIYILFVVLMSLPYFCSGNAFWRLKTKKLNKTTLQQTYTNKSIMKLRIIFVLLFHFFKHSEKFFEGKQHISQIRHVAQYLGNPKNSSIGHLISLWLNDNDNTRGVGLGCVSESIDQGRSYYLRNINISYCFFTRYLTFSGNGGVICVNTGSFSMNINYSMFHNCVCSNEGGAILFNSVVSCIRMICANSCSAFYFAFAQLRASQDNHVEYLSVSNCSHATSGYYTIYLGAGNERVDLTNSSMNYAKDVSGLFIYYPTSFTSSHCTFSNNKVSDSRCIYFSSGSETITMSYANIAHNNSPSLGVVYVDGTGSKKMMYCIFHDNQNYLFCVYKGSLELSHSFIDHLSSSFSQALAVSTANNNSLINRMTFLLHFFNSHHCNADMPLIDTKPVITLENSPIRSLEKTFSRINEETLRITYERTIDQTIRRTQKENIPRTYSEFKCSNQIANKREISFIFAFAYTVIL